MGETPTVNEPDHLTTSRIVYDHSAGDYVAGVGTAVSAKFEAPLDRAVLDAFAESIGSQDVGPVLDAGCGPGRVAAYLADRGLDVCGVDISVEMIAAARTAHPHLGFDEGSLTSLPLPDRSVWISSVTWPSAIRPRRSATGTQSTRSDSFGSVGSPMCSASVAMKTWNV